MKNDNIPANDLIPMESSESKHHLSDSNDHDNDSKSGKGFKKIFKNFSLLSIGKIGGDFFTFILFIVLSRKFGQQGIGQYSFAVGLTGFFSVLADFGLYNYSIKEISRNRESFEKHSQNIFSLRLVLAFIMTSLLFVIIPILNFSIESKIIIILVGIYQILYTLIEGLSAIFIAHERMNIAAAIEISLKIITTSSAITVIFTTGSLVIALSMLPLMAILQLIIITILIRNKFGTKIFTFSPNLLKSTFRTVSTFGVTDLLFQLYSRVDIVLIGFLLGESSAGLYNVSFRVVFFLLFIPKFASLSIFPIISLLFRESRSDFTKMFNKSLNLMIIIGLPISTGLFLIAPDFIEIVFGPEFSESSLILRILSGLFFINCASYLMEFFLMASDRQNERTKSYWYATFLSTIMNYILIINFKITGAAFAVMLSSLFLLITLAIKLRPVVGFPEINPRFLVSIFGTFNFLLFFMFVHTSIFIVIPVSVLIYFSTVMIFKDIRENELWLFLDLFKKKNC